MSRSQFSASYLLFALNNSDSFVTSLYFWIVCPCLLVEDIKWIKVIRKSNNLSDTVAVSYVHLAPAVARARNDAWAEGLFRQSAKWLFMSDITNQLLANFAVPTRSFPPDRGQHEYRLLGISSRLLVSQSLHEASARELPPETAWSTFFLGYLVSSSPVLCMAIKIDKGVAWLRLSSLSRTVKQTTHSLIHRPWPMDSWEEMGTGNGEIPSWSGVKGSRSPEEQRKFYSAWC